MIFYSGHLPLICSIVYELSKKTLHKRKKSREDLVNSVFKKKKVCTAVQGFLIKHNLSYSQGKIKVGQNNKQIPYTSLSHKLETRHIFNLHQWEDKSPERKD